MLDKPEVLAEVTERPRFIPWEFDTPNYAYMSEIDALDHSAMIPLF